MLGGPLGYSLGNCIKANRTLRQWCTPIANWYANAMGYRAYGFKYDDLLVEERPDVQRALGRLTTQEAYERAFRLKRASQASIMHAPLPKEQWTKPEEDVRYLRPHVLEVEKEDNERQMWDTITVQKKH